MNTQPNGQATSAGSEPLAGFRGIAVMSNTTSAVILFIGGAALGAAVASYAMRKPPARPTVPGQDWGTPRSLYDRDRDAWRT